MSVKENAFQLALGVAAGYAATRLAGAFPGAAAPSPEAHGAQADDCRHRAVHRIARALDVELNTAETDDLAETLHTLVGLMWGPLYFFYRAAGLDPAPAGLATGAHVALAVDEGLIPLLGLRPERRNDSWRTHARGWMDRLGRGLAVAVAAESLAALSSAARRGR